MNKHTFSNGDILEMKALQHAEFASEETHCYEAKLYLNGKLFAYVSNDGRGASDSQDPASGLTYQDVRDLDKRCLEELPKQDSQWSDDPVSISLEYWCCDAVNYLLAKKDVKRLMRSKILYQTPSESDSLRGASYKGVKKITERHIEVFKSKNPDAIILNEMDDDEATAIFRKTAC